MKLESALEALVDFENVDNASAANKFVAFKNEVAAQSGQKITPADAATLTAQADSVISKLSK